MDVYQFRVDAKLKKEFFEKAKTNNRKASQILRDCMSNYIQENRADTTSLDRSGDTA